MPQGPLIAKPAPHSQRFFKDCARLLALGLILFGLYRLPSSYNPLVRADLATFVLFDYLLRSAGRSWGNLSALLNSESADLAMYIAVLGLSSIALVQLPSEKKRGECWRLALYYLLLTLAGYSFKALVQKVFALNRLSPTLDQPGAFRLCREQFSFDFKDRSRRCFPGDHALFLFSWALFWSAGYPRWCRWSALGIAILFSLPRLLVSGHWLTDLVLGGWLTAWIFARLLFVSPWWNRPPREGVRVNFCQKISGLDGRESRSGSNGH